MAGEKIACRSEAKPRGFVSFKVPPGIPRQFSLLWLGTPPSSPRSFHPFLSSCYILLLSPTPPPSPRSDRIHGFESRSISSERFFSSRARVSMIDEQRAIRERNRYAVVPLSRWRDFDATRGRGGGGTFATGEDDALRARECGRTRRKKEGTVGCFRGSFQPAFAFSNPPFLSSLFFFPPSLCLSAVLPRTFRRPACLVQTPWTLSA